MTDNNQHPITPPPSLKELALAELDYIPTHDYEGRTVDVDVSTIRRALEQLDD